MAKAYAVMSGLLANACPEEPDALIALVRVCGGAPRVTGGSTRKIETADFTDYADSHNIFQATEGTEDGERCYREATCRTSSAAQTEGFCK